MGGPDLVSFSVSIKTEKAITDTIIFNTIPIGIA